MLIAYGLLALLEPLAIPPRLSALCPKGEPGEIVVCADPDPPKSPYRLPLPTLPEVGARGTASVSRERNALLEPGPGGIGSCSTAGAGGWTGCSYGDFKRNVEQAAGGSDPRGRVYSRNQRE